MSPPGGRILTVAVCAFVLACFSMATAQLTSGFRYWTFEEKRIALAGSGKTRVQPVELHDASGNKRQLWRDGVEKDIYLVDFIYTRCPSVCQTLGSEYQRMQQILLAHKPRNSRIRLLSISFDERDRIDDLQGYALRYRASPPIWTVARASSSTQTQRLLDQLEVVVIKDGMGGYTHNGAIHLINGQGRLLAIYPYENWEDALSAAMLYAANFEKRGL